VILVLSGSPGAKYDYQYKETATKQYSWKMEIINKIGYFRNVASQFSQPQAGRGSRTKQLFIQSKFLEKEAAFSNFRFVPSFEFTSNQPII
jgi:hypothetical protein